MTKYKLNINFLPIFRGYTIFKTGTDKISELCILKDLFGLKNHAVKAFFTQNQMVFMDLLKQEQAHSTQSEKKKISTIGNILTHLTNIIVGKTIPTTHLFGKSIKYDNDIKFLIMTSTIEEYGNLNLHYTQKNKLYQALSFYLLGLDCLNQLKGHIFHTISNDWLNKRLSQTALDKENSNKMLEEKWGGQEAYKSVAFLKDDISKSIEKNPSVLILFTAEWCPHCLAIKKKYGLAAKEAKKENLNIVFATYDVNHNIKIADEFGVIGIPIIKYYLNGKFITNYKGNRTTEDILNFAKNPRRVQFQNEKPELL